MRRLLLQIAGSAVGLWLAGRFVNGVQVLGGWQVLVIIGAVLGTVNFFLKPLLSALTLPLKILTLGLSGLIINMVLVWLVDVAFLELIIQGLAALVWTTLIVWLVNFILQKWIR